MRKIQEFLEQSSDHLSQAMSSSRVVITSQDLDLRYTWVFNPGQAGLKDTVGKKLEDFASEDHIGVVQPIKRKVLETGEPQQKVINITLQGQKRTFDMTVVPAFDEGKMVGLTTISVDISDLVSAQEELHQAHARLLGLIGDKVLGRKIRSDH